MERLALWLGDEAIRLLLNQESAGKRKLSDAFITKVVERGNVGLWALARQNHKDLVPIADLKCYDRKLILELFNLYKTGNYGFPQEFIGNVYASGDEELRERIRNDETLVNKFVLDVMLAENDADYLCEHIESLGKEMNARHVVALIKLGNKDLIDSYFNTWAKRVWDYEAFASVVEYLKSEGLEKEYRRRYLDKMTLKSKY